MLARTPAALEAAAHGELAGEITAAAPEAEVSARPDVSEAGGGSLPTYPFPTWVVVVRSPSCGRRRSPRSCGSATCRLSAACTTKALLFDVRTLEADEAQQIPGALAEVVLERQGGERGSSAACGQARPARGYRFLGCAYNAALARDDEVFGVGFEAFPGFADAFGFVAGDHAVVLDAAAHVGQQLAEVLDDLLRDAEQLLVAVDRGHLGIGHEEPAAGVAQPVDDAGVAGRVVQHAEAVEGVGAPEPIGLSAEGGSWHHL